MFIVTFYSYKGGVGRTMALANTAYRLSARGKKVFILDFDLEAPGLDVFFPAPGSTLPGIVEYVSDYSESGTVPQLQDFVVEVRPGDASHGPIYCMRAGRGDEDYQRHLARLNWKEFYAQSDGFLFVENLKGAIDATFSPDYVLVDSRTGLTDVSGICTLQLPNLVVFLFALNDQNLRGTARIHKSVVQNRLNRHVETLLVASPVPDVPDYVDLKKKRMARAAEYFNHEVDLTLPFAPFVAFEETVLPPWTSGTYLGEAYDKLSDKIIELNQSDILTLLKEARRLRMEGDPDRAETKYREIIEAFPNSADAWRGLGLFLRSSRRPDEAATAFSKALQIGGRVRDIAELALTLLSIGNEAGATEKFLDFIRKSSNTHEIEMFTELFDSRGQIKAAIAGYTKLLELQGADTQSAPVLLQLGNLHMQGKNPKEAVSFYERARQLQPNYLAATYNLGYALHLLGRLDEARSYFQPAVEMYEQTQDVRLTPPKRANLLEAIGQAHAALGNVEKAKASFEGALALTEGLQSPIFSAVRYTDVSTAEFRAEVSGLLQQLKSEPAITHTTTHHKGT